MVESKPTVPATDSAQKPAVSATAVPWWKNQLFWGMVGSGIVSAADNRLHLGIPQTATVWVTVGLAVAWGLHTVITAWADHSHSKDAQAAEAWLNAMMPHLERFVANLEGKTPPGGQGS